MSRGALYNRRERLTCFKHRFKQKKIIHEACFLLPCLIFYLTLSYNKRSQIKAIVASKDLVVWNHQTIKT